MHSLRLAMILVAGVVFALLPRGAAPAGCRVVALSHHKQAAIVYQPAYAQPYLYQVGAEFRTAASEDRIANLVVQKLQAQQLTAQPQQAPQTLPLTAEVDRWALVKANCAGCHTTNEKAVAHIDMTDLAALTCEQKLAMAAAVLDGKMPPKKQLEPSVLGNLLGEIVGAQTVEH